MLNLIKTADGSLSLRNSQIDETYHSVHGAEQESRYVFIKQGLELKSKQKTSIKIFEVGFGTGLNAILTYEFANSFPEIKVDYHCIEPFPIDKELIPELSKQYNEQQQQVFLKLHNSVDKSILKLNESFNFTKTQIDLLNYNSGTNFDLIYFDAFGPRAQPEMWSKEMLSICFNLLLPKGVWVSYCAKGEVRRDLESIGFLVERIPGPPGKREMLRAIKSY